MTVKTSRCAVALMLCGILAAAAVAQAADEAKSKADPAKAAPAADQAKSKLPVNPKLSVTPPEGAIVLFGGKAEQMRDNFYARRSTDPAGWTVDDKGVATPNKRDISSKQEFGDCYLHAEFCVPTGEGNSGVGMEGRYEVQILNSFGKAKPGVQDCGAYFTQVPPKVNACKPAGEWQTFDIFFRARGSTPPASSPRRPAPPSTRTAP